MMQIQLECIAEWDFSSPTSKSGDKKFKPLTLDLHDGAKISDGKYFLILTTQTEEREHMWGGGKKGGRREL
eukprot:1062475-Amorphochlora_amoeboformis.AAC.1